MGTVTSYKYSFPDALGEEREALWMVWEIDVPFKRGSDLFHLFDIERLRALITSDSHETISDEWLAENIGFFRLRTAERGTFPGWPVPHALDAVLHAATPAQTVFYHSNLWLRGGARQTRE